MNKPIDMTIKCQRHKAVPSRRMISAGWRIVMTGWLWLAMLGLGGTMAFAQETSSTNAPEKFANADCLACHLDPNTTRVVSGKTESLVFPTNTFQKSIHAKLACVDCHTGVKDLVHDPLGPPDCTHCHQKEAEAYATSIHGVSHLL